MSLHLVAPAARLLADIPAARRLLSVVESHGGTTLLIGPPPDATNSVLLPAEIADPPSSAAEWEALLSRRGWSPDETVLLAADLASARIAAAARLKVGVLSPALAAADMASHRWDEVWRDLEDVSRWCARHGQLAQRAWPIATVGGLVFAPDDTALFVRTAKWSGTWGVPGGKIDYGEASTAAFLREIREETGLEAFDPELVLVQDAIEEPEFFRPRHFLLLNYRARCATKAFRLNHESLEASWFTLTQALELPLNRPTRHLVEALLDPAHALVRQG